MKSSQMIGTAPPTPTRTTRKRKGEEKKKKGQSADWKLAWKQSIAGADTSSGDMLFHLYICRLDGLNVENVSVTLNALGPVG